MAILSITCPQCHGTFTFTTYPAIDTKDDGMWAEKVRTGEAFLGKCPHCGWETHYDYSFLYKEREKNFLMYYAANEADYKSGYAMMTGHDPMVDWEKISSWTRRVVTSREDVLEKLMILDDGLDDRIIEILKALAFVSLHQHKPELSVDTVLFDRGSDGNHYFRFSEKGKVVAAYAFERPMYERVKRNLGENLRHLTGGEVVINSQWAVKALWAMQK